MDADGIEFFLVITVFRLWRGQYGWMSLDPRAPYELSEVGEVCSSRWAIFEECPHCGFTLNPEHAHFRCVSCGWRDSCCD